MKHRGLEYPGLGYLGLGYLWLGYYYVGVGTPGVGVPGGNLLYLGVRRGLDYLTGVQGLSTSTWELWGWGNWMYLGVGYQVL